jgi:hypothetical protein
MRIRIKESQINADPNPKLSGCPTPALLSEKGLIARKNSSKPREWNPGPPDPTVALYVVWGITPRKLGDAHNKHPDSL